jgi:hypothetical protein
MPPELVRQSTELFAREVMPYLRETWGEWEDRWSPRPLVETERAIPARVGFDSIDRNGTTGAGTTTNQPRLGK